MKILAIALLVTLINQTGYSAVIYQLIEPAPQNGFSISGQIETDGSFGSINNTNIVGWDIQATNGISNFYFSSDLPNHTVNTSSTFLLASNENISISEGSFLLFSDGKAPPNRPLTLQWERRMLNSEQKNWFSMYETPTTYFRTDPYFVSSPQSLAIVPEPGVEWLLIFAFLILVVKKYANRAIHRMATRVTPDAGSLSLPAIGRATATHR